MDAVPTILCIVLCILVVPLMYLVHVALRYCSHLVARRYCIKRGLTVARSRCGVLFDGGVKTEFFLVELDCMDSQKGRQLVRLAVWIFGVHRVLTIQPFPEGEQDPQFSVGWRE